MPQRYERERPMKALPLLVSTLLLAAACHDDKPAEGPAEKA